MLYLADRRALELSERPITGDTYVSMKNGPVLSATKDLIGEEKRETSYWCRHISAPSNYAVRLDTDPGSDELCDFETEILSEIYEEYGHMDRFVLADLTHVICPEWKDPEACDSKVLPLSVEAILKALDKSPEEIKRIEEEVMAERSLNVILAGSHNG